MALDGIVIANIVSDMKGLIGSRISKITQPEKDELSLLLNGEAGQVNLHISASPSLPLIYISEDKKPAPITAPNFCMLLRKHIGNGRISNISQPSLERIIHIEIEHLNELGDPSKKYLIIELMGKYSNIIFVDDEDIIIDSIKRVPAFTSSIREVLPKRKYFIPEELKKEDSLSISKEEFVTLLICDEPANKAICAKLSGISPLVAEEICYRAGVNSDMPADRVTAGKIFDVFEKLRKDILSGNFHPQIVYKDGIPYEFSSTNLTIYKSFGIKQFENSSSMLLSYFKEKDEATRMRQKSADLRKIVTTALSREAKKLDLQEKQLKDTENRDKYRKYGELLRAYNYMLKDGEKTVTVEDYENDNKEITISLDETKTISENANRFFERYQKLRRTNEALIPLIKETKEKIEELNEIKSSLELSQNEDDLAQIKEELFNAGYINKPIKKQKGSKGSFIEPMHFVSSDGYDIYVGKNNIQNEYVTFEIAGANDWWFHVKGMPGSHVIVKSGEKELPDRVYEEAGMLAAFYSSATPNEKVEVDYTLRKNLKKPAGSRPGLVIYHTNYSLIATAKKPDFN